MPVAIPWWALTYLVIVALVSVASAIGDFRDKKFSSYATIVSLVFIFILVASFFDEGVAARLGYGVIPITIGGLIWEFSSAVVDTQKAAQEFRGEPDLTDEEKEQVLNAAIFINGLIVLPGYLAGVKLCLDLFN